MYCMSGWLKVLLVVVVYVMFKMWMSLMVVKVFVEGWYSGGYRGMRLKREDEEAFEAFEREFVENLLDVMLEG